ncbi:MAG TPA: hypothetical protein PKX17_06400, partial [Candidatus Methanomethylicus sp.]|nr:hypothetical protein [Candidatus Methanomethylicus sp.]
TIVSINAQVHPPGLFPPGSKTIWRLYKQTKEDQAMRHSVPGKWICCLTDRSLGDVFLPEQLERLCLTYELEDVSAIPECDEGGSGWVSCYEETSSILWNVIFQAGRRLPSGPLVALAGNALPTHPESRSAVMRWFKDAWIKTDRPPEVADMITHALIDLRADGMLCFDSTNGPDRLGVYMNTCMRLSSTNDLLRDCQGIEYILRETTSQGEGYLTPAELAILGHPTEHIGWGIILPSRPACRHQGRVSEMCESDLVSGVDSTRYLLWAGNLSDSYAIFQVEACFKSDGVWLVSLAGQVRGSTDLINLQMHIIANKHSQSIRQWYETACKDRREEDMGRFSFLVPFSAIYSPTGSPHWKSARCMHEALAFLHDHHNERFWKPANDTTALPHQR